MITTHFVVPIIIAAAAFLLGHWVGQRQPCETHETRDRVDAVYTGEGPAGIVHPTGPGWAPAPDPSPWWATATSIHRDTCHMLRHSRAEPLRFAITTSDAREIADRDRLRACRHCDPLTEQAVTTS